jgi:ABC-type methionine transport system ATPase subunit
MAKKHTKIMRFRMNFPPSVLGEPFIYKLSHDMKVIPNIMRGRISEKGAWLEVEVEGTQKNIQKALDFLKRRGVEVFEITI